KLPSKTAAVVDIGEPQDPKFFQLLGFFISSANDDPTALHLDSCLPNQDQIDEFTTYVSQTWGERAYNDDYPNQLMLSPAEVGQPISSDRDFQTGNTLTATLTNRRLLSRLSAFARIDGNSRRLGDEAFTAGLPAQRHFLRALFTADAAVVNGSVELRSD